MPSLSRRMTVTNHTRKMVGFLFSESGERTFADGGSG